MTPKDSSTLHYAALVIAKAERLDEFRAKFHAGEDFAEVERQVKSGGTYQFIIGGKDDRFGVIVALPDGTFAACAAMNEWVFDNHEEAQALAERLSRPGEDSDGAEVLVMSFTPPPDAG
ncbi:MAG: hypothetical protein GX576_07815 [Thauera phenolivorans]|uniref:Uncharacterized protein n=1 Tax=Thauera phenolivorans TaxID=1792543 RepID=A0A7X7LW11_9RHOO|nr:hypothetical protein [Thauera phenolivorans]NLF54288.1 hypothetical protein [Thauera phenolivorans]